MIAYGVLMTTEVSGTKYNFGLKGQCHWMACTSKYSYNVFLLNDCLWHVEDNVCMALQSKVRFKVRYTRNQSVGLVI